MSRIRRRRGIPTLAASCGTVSPHTHSLPLPTHRADKYAGSGFLIYRGFNRWVGGPLPACVSRQTAHVVEALGEFPCLLAGLGWQPAAKGRMRAGRRAQAA